MPLLAAPTPAGLSQIVDRVSLLALIQTALEREPAFSYTSAPFFPFLSGRNQRTSRIKRRQLERASVRLRRALPTAIGCRIA
jgi:hypothetical protein